MHVFFKEQTMKYSYNYPQMRDFVGFMSTRKRILELKPTQRQSWVAFAVSNYAAGEFNIAVDVISKYYEHTKVPWIFRMTYTYNRNNSH